MTQNTIKNHDTVEYQNAVVNEYVASQYYNIHWSRHISSTDRCITWSLATTGHSGASSSNTCCIQQKKAKFI